MKVKRYNNSWKKFKDVKIGEVFIDDEEEIAMKIESKFSDKIGKYNAINLESGRFIIVGDEENYMVKILNCELVFKQPINKISF